jgi:hypothetical protein
VAHRFWLLTHIIKNKKCFSNLIPLSHKEYMTFGDDKKGKVIDTSTIKVNDHFTLNDIALVDKLRYNLLFVSQSVDANLDVLFRKSGSHVLNSSVKACMWHFSYWEGFQADFSFVQSSVKTYSKDCPCSCLRATFFVLLVVMELRQCRPRLAATDCLVRLEEGEDRWWAGPKDGPTGLCGPMATGLTQRKIKRNGIGPLRMVG